MTPPPASILTDGEGPDLLLIHGTATGAESFAPLMRLLRDRVRTTAYHRRGTPGWPVSPGAEPASVEEHAAHAADLVRGAGRGAFHVLGASFGGVVALELARRSPDLVRSVALFEPGIAIDAPHAVPRAMLAEFEAALARGRADEAVASFHRRILGEAMWERLPPEARERAIAMGPHIHGDLRAAATHCVTSAGLRAISVPFLLMRGARSRPVFETVLRGLHESLPLSRIEVLEHADHQLWGRAWTELGRALSAFLGV